MSEIMEKIQDQPMTDELRKSFTDYALSVIVSRALPDVRDGLKPVHRRILYTMESLSYRSTDPYKKSARVVGDVMGRFHPHGDSAIYDAMVRMAQPWAMRLRLVDGQGNFGSLDGDAAAAMRYTEARLTKQASLMVDDLVTSKKEELEAGLETVGFRTNYDESLLEPTVLPTRIPNLLINGSEGIAVGMATKMAPHNPVEAINACLAFIANPEMTVDDVLEIMPGPDFPTGAHIMGDDGIRQAYETGKGSIILRAVHEIEEHKKSGKKSISFTEIPYQVNKTKLLERIAELSDEKKIEGISDVQDYSDKKGIRITVDLRRDADPQRVLAQLHRQTDLQTSFAINAMAIDGGRPRLMGVIDLLRAFIDFRREVITKRTRYELKKARELGNVLLGLVAALTNIDRILEIVRASESSAQALETLMAEPLPREGIADLLIGFEGEAGTGAYFLNEAQAKAILDMKIQRLTGLEREKLVEDARAQIATIEYCRDVLTNPESRDAVMVKELEEARDRVTDKNSKRLTKLMPKPETYNPEDFIQRQDCVVSLTHSGYIKWVPLAAFRSQRRGGAGKVGMGTKDEDAVASIVSTHTHASMVCFTDRGMAHEMKVFQLPEGTPQSKGRPMVNFLPGLRKDEKIAKTLILPDATTADNKTLLFVTKEGYVRRNDIATFTNIRSNGKIAMKLGGEDGNPDNDGLVDVLICDDNDQIVLMTEKGQAVRFPAHKIRVMTTRNSFGVRGIRLMPGDRVLSAAVVSAAAIGADIPDPDLLTDTETMIESRGGEPALLTVTELGFGKRTPVSAYRLVNRGSKGVSDRPKQDRCGSIISSFVVFPDDEVMIMTAQGTVIRTRASEIRTAGRNSLGVRLLRLKRDDAIVSVVRVANTFGSTFGDVFEDEHGKTQAVTGGGDQADDGQVPTDDAAGSDADSGADPGPQSDPES